MVALYDCIDQTACLLVSRHHISTLFSSCFYDVDLNRKIIKKIYVYVILLRSKLSMPLKLIFHRTHTEQQWPDH
jgi:hypothetical protein